MDELDIGIVREFAHSNHAGMLWGELSPSCRMTGKKLGYSGATIRERVREMTRSGFLKAFQVQVNPSLLGFNMGAMAVDVPPTADKSALMHRLSFVDGVLLIASHLGTLMGLVLYYEDEEALEKKANLVASVCDATKVKYTEIPYPPPSVELSEKDWQVVDSLQRRLPGHPRDIADELGMSTRTLKRRLKRLADGMAIATIVSADMSRLRGGVAADLEVEYLPGASREQAEREVTRKTEPFAAYTGLWTRFSLLTLILPNIPAGSELLDTVRSISGVAGARLDFMENRVEVYSTLREQVKRKVAIRPS